MMEPLTQLEEAIFLGTLLGDGHIQKRKNSYRTKIQHCLKQADYVYWKYNQFKRLSHDHTYPKQLKTKDGSGSYYFFLKSGLYLKKYHDLFYKSYIWQSLNNFEPKSLKAKVRYKKTISEELIQFLPDNRLLLAVWFMDDGHIRTNAFSGKLGTYAFSKQEHFLLQDYVFSTFGIKTNIVLASRLKSQYYLTIPGKNKNFERFVDLIKPVVEEIPSMQYKIRNPKKSIIN